MVKRFSAKKTRKHLVVGLVRLFLSQKLGVEYVGSVGGVPVQRECSKSTILISKISISSSNKDKIKKLRVARIITINVMILYLIVELVHILEVSRTLLFTSRWTMACCMTNRTTYSDHIFFQDISFHYSLSSRNKSSVVVSC